LWTPPTPEEVVGEREREKAMSGTVPRPLTPMTLPPSGKTAGTASQCFVPSLAPCSYHHESRSTYLGKRDRDSQRQRR
jgi:hypothetical protein